MLRRLGNLRGSDSPFRYKNNVRVSPSVVSKRFGEDVLIFASPNKIDSVARDVLGGNLLKEPTKGFWEIFAKRVNESVHLLKGKSIVNVLTAFDKSSGRSDLLAGMCHFVSEDLSKSNEITRKYGTIQEVVGLATYLQRYSNAVSPKCYRNILTGFIELSYQVTTRHEVVDIVKCLTKLNAPRTPELEELLVKRLADRIKLPILDGASFVEIDKAISES
jgi:hypothetical protein